MQHEPYGLGLVQADLNEVIARAERTEVVCVVPTVELRMLRQNRFVAGLQLRQPDSPVPFGNVAPGAAITGAAVVRPAMRHGSFNRRPNAMQIVRQIARVETGLNGHHPAAYIHANRGRNDCALRRNHAADGRPHSPMDVRHGRDPFEDERKLRDIQELLARRVLKGYAFRPRFHWQAALGREHVVCGFRHLCILYSLILRRQLLKKHCSTH